MTRKSSVRELPTSFLLLSVCTISSNLTLEYKPSFKTPSLKAPPCSK